VTTFGAHTRRFGGETVNVLVWLLLTRSSIEEKKCRGY